jgi:hypothetical protein
LIEGSEHKKYKNKKKNKEEEEYKNLIEDLKKMNESINIDILILRSERRSLLRVK